MFPFLPVAFIFIPSIFTLSAETIHIDLSHGIDNNDAHSTMPADFWLNSGFCPPAPTNDSRALNAFLNGRTVRRSLRMMSAWPAVQVRRARTSMRVHWLLNLIEARWESDDDEEGRSNDMMEQNIRRKTIPHSWNSTSDRIEYDFRQLDTFFDHLVRDADMVPVVELMGDPFRDCISSAQRKAFGSSLWQDLVTQLVERYIGMWIVYLTSYITSASCLCNIVRHANCPS